MAEIKLLIRDPSDLWIKHVNSKTIAFRWDLHICGLRSTIRATVQKVKFLINSGASFYIYIYIFWCYIDSPRYEVRAWRRQPKRRYRRSAKLPRRLYVVGVFFLFFSCAGSCMESSGRFWKGRASGQKSAWILAIAMLSVGWKQMKIKAVEERSCGRKKWGDVATVAARWPLPL
jgi:hypothetical protein